MLGRKITNMASKDFKYGIKGLQIWHQRITNMASKDFDENVNKDQKNNKLSFSKTISALPGVTEYELQNEIQSKEECIEFSVASKDLCDNLNRDDESKYRFNDKLSLLPEVTEEEKSKAGFNDVSLRCKQARVSKQRIVTAKSGEEYECYVEEFFDCLMTRNGQHLTERALSLPAGIRFPNKEGYIHLPSSNMYREGKEFEVLGILAEGNKSEPIKRVKDNMNGMEHALKTYHLNDLKMIGNIKNEILCWLYQQESGNVPELYMFQLQNNKLMIHMELLENTVTLFELRHMIISDESKLHRPFAIVYVSHLILSVMKEFHKTGWVHNDLNFSNILLQITSEECLKIYILDFERAAKNDSVDFDISCITDDVGDFPNGQEELQSEIHNSGYDNENQMIKCACKLIHEHLQLQKLQPQELESTTLSTAEDVNNEFNVSNKRQKQGLSKAVKTEGIKSPSGCLSLNSAIVTSKTHQLN